jgi:two-component system cell cycle response regulator
MPTPTPSVVRREEHESATPARAAVVAKPRSVRMAMTLRKVLRLALGPTLALTLGAGFVVVEGRRLAVSDPSILGAAILFVAYGARLLVRILERMRSSPTRDPTAAAIDAELAMLAQIGALGAAMHLPGGLDGAGYGVVYGAIALVATFASRKVTVWAAVMTIAMEMSVRAIGGEPSLLRAVWVHAAVLTGFAVLNGLVLRRRIERIGLRARRRVEREVERMREQARSYRLLDGPASLPAGGNAADASGGVPKSVALDAERATRSGVEEIQMAVRFALDLLKRSLGAHSAVLLFETKRGERSDAKGARHGALKLAEVATDAKAIAEGPFGMGDGVLGAVVRRRAAVSLHGLRPGYRVPYYPAPLAEGGVTSLLAVPILEEGTVRGVLCVDRLPARELREGEGEHDRAFTAHEEELVSSAARYILRAIENERVFGRLERAKAEQDQLYAASQRLSGALTEAEVIEAGVESARAIASFDLAAITVVHEAEGGGTRNHEVRAVAGAADFEALVGLRFGDNGGLVAQATKSRCSLPHRGDHDPATQVVFTRRHPLRVELFDKEAGDDDDESTRSAEVRSILVVPLTLRDRALGTLVLGARRRGAFRDLSGSLEGARTTLEVLASHIATSLANARMFAKLEELATTDGLTGLLNKRVLLELGAQKVRAAVRYGKPLSVIQTDIDHFKKINDTFGHDVGDQVIKGLAGILRRLKRGTDYVARFGGEEFVIICEETDAEGALHLAERVREELSRTTFHATPSAHSSGAGGTTNFHVTCSLGVATYPADGATWDSLYKATDDALYASKRTGRNRTTVASSLKAVG